MHGFFECFQVKHVFQSKTYKGELNAGKDTEQDSTNSFRDIDLCIGIIDPNPIQTEKMVKISNYLNFLKRSDII